jgi:hypothetical protein
MGRLGNRKNSIFLGYAMQVCFMQQKSFYSFIKSSLWQPQKQYIFRICHAGAFYALELL